MSDDTQNPTPQRKKWAARKTKPQPDELAKMTPEEAEEAMAKWRERRNRKPWKRKAYHRKKYKRKRGPKPTKPLTDMQRLFVKYYVHEQMSKTGAARAAGYAHPEKIANRMAKVPRVAQYIAKERKKYEEASGVTKKKVVEGMLEAAEIAKTKADPTGMVQAWREIGKLCGHYEPTKHEVNVSVNGQIMMQRIHQMSDEELLQLAEREANDAIEGEFEEVTEDEDSKYLALSSEHEDAEDDEYEDDEFEDDEYEDDEFEDDEFEEYGDESDQEDPE